MAFSATQLIKYQLKADCSLTFYWLSLVQRVVALKYYVLVSLVFNVFSVSHTFVSNTELCPAHKNYDETLI
jgi:hypothetical protein